MNKRGFSLVELIVTLAIMSMLVILIIPSIIDFRNDMVNKTYLSRVTMINNAALDWANDNLVLVPSNVLESDNPKCNSSSDNNCACIQVSYLINNGYLSGSDENRTVMKNPITNESMNDKYACVRYNSNDILTRKLISNIVE